MITYSFEDEIHLRPLTLLFFPSLIWMNLGFEKKKNPHRLTRIDMAQYFGNLLQNQVERAEMCGITLELSFHVTKKDDPNIKPDSILPGIHLFWERPDLQESFDNLLKSIEGGFGVGCGVCGPASLSSEMRRVVGSISLKEAQRVGGITFHSWVSLSVWVYLEN